MRRKNIPNRPTKRRQPHTYYVHMRSCARQPANTSERQHEPNPHPHLIMCAVRHAIYYTILLYNPTPLTDETDPHTLAGELLAAPDASARAG